MLFNYNIPFLNDVLEKVIFVQIKREPLSNIQSVLAARESQLGNKKTWYSFKIPEFDDLKKLDPVSQAAGQVACINRAVDIGLNGVAKNRKIVLTYEEFCANPEKVFTKLVDQLSSQGCAINTKYSGAKHFTPSNQLLLSPAEANLAMQVYQQFTL